MSNFKTDCIFYGVYKDHGASVPYCCFNGDYDLVADIDRLEHCPCKFYTTLHHVRDYLLKSSPSEKD